jgi:hypothetical protein
MLLIEGLTEQPKRCYKSAEELPRNGAEKQKM